jgi:transcriptional regulator with XRE-family HTH domain
MNERVRTLKDLADKLDVSVATVSRALAGHERIAKETRERVAEAARPLRLRAEPRRPRPGLRPLGLRRPRDADARARAMSTPSSASSSPG